LARVSHPEVRDENLALVLAPGALEGAKADIGAYRRRFIVALVALTAPMGLLASGLAGVFGGIIIFLCVMVFAFGLSYTLVYGWKLAQAIRHRRELEHMLRQRGRID